MKSTVKLTLLAAILVSALSTLSSCKKGKEDPFLSFRSRDARLKGTWKLTGIEGTGTEKSTFGSSTVTQNYTMKYVDGVETLTNSSGSSTRKYTVEITFEKNGKISCVATGYPGNQFTTFTSGGTWNWLNTNKNKSKLSVYPDDGNIYNYFGGDYDVQGLKNKELRLNQVEYTKSVDNNSTDESSSDITWIFEPK